MARYPKKREKKKKIVRGSKDDWIHDAIKRPGRVRRYVRRNFGEKAFEANGGIKPTYLTKAKEIAKSHDNRSMVDAIDLAITMDGWHK